MSIPTLLGRFVGFVLIVTVLTSCTQWKKLTGQDGGDNPGASIPVLGLWSGFVNVAGVTEYFHFHIETGDKGLAGLFFGESSGFTGKINGGSVSGASFTMTLDEGTGCANKFTAAGSVSGNSMTVTITGLGNTVSGTTCHSGAINTTVTLGR